MAKKPQTTRATSRRVARAKNKDKWRCPKHGAGSFSKREGYGRYRCGCTIDRVE